MPDFTFQGHAPGMYPMLRDVYDQPAGTVTPGDVLRLHEAPDQDWVPCEDGGEQTPDSEGAGSGPAWPPSPPQAGPAAAPASQPTAGVTGSEED